MSAESSARELRYEQRQGLLQRTTFDRVIILKPGTDELIELRGTAARVWGCFREPTTPERVTSLLASWYAVDAAAVRTDIDPLLQELLQRRLLCEVR